MKSKTDTQVAVIIPFYNGSKWIERAIQSVFGQTLQPAEFVIVNDGAMESERTALGELAKKYPFKVIDQENGGQGSARNTGVASTKAPYICFLDQDDYYLPRHIEDLLEALPENDPRLAFVYGDFCHADIDGQIIHSSLLTFLQPDRHPKRGHIADIIKNDLFILPSATLIKRVAFEAVGGFDVQFRGYEDDDLFLRLFRAGYTNIFLTIPVYVWCMHRDSTSWSITMSRSRFRYFIKLVNTFPDDYHNSIYYLRDCIAPRFSACFLQEAVKARLGNKNKDTEEIMGIFNKFVNLMINNAHISKRTRRRLIYADKVLRAYPAFMLKTSKLVRRAMRTM